MKRAQRACAITQILTENGEEWRNLEEETKDTLIITLNETNAHSFYRLIVTIG